jgi:hypothetical protein
MGEFLIKLDIKYNLTYWDNYQPQSSYSKILDASSIYENNLKLNENQNRIMIIGDSYIEGIGINKPFRFKSQLNDFLIKNNNSSKEHIILNLSRTGNNTIDKYLSFLEYYTIYQPHIIIWFHTINDLSMDSRKVIGIKEDLIKFENKFTDNNQSDISTVKNLNTISKSLQLKKEPIKHKTIAHNLEGLIDKYSLLKYLKENIVNELLLRGVLIPYGDFYEITQNLYKNNREEFKLYKLIFYDVLKKLKDNTTLIVYSMPEYNLINQPQYFKNIDTALFEFFSNKNILFIDGKTNLVNHTFDEVSFTRSDGHPNSFAHRIITNTIGKLILNSF